MKPWVKVWMVTVGILALLALAWIVVHAAAISPEQGTVWLTATGVVVAAVALAAATVAAVFAYPAYRDWVIAQPHRGDIWISIWAAAKRWPDELVWVEGEQPHEVFDGSEGMFVRVAVHNDGHGVVRAGLLNIMVPADFEIGPDDDLRIVHYLMRGTAGNAQIQPGTVTTVRATAARDDFPPGVRAFHVQLSNLMPGDQVPLLVELDGTGLQSPITRRAILVARDSPCGAQKPTRDEA